MFTKEDTRAIKGIAVIFMLFHHLATFPERYPVDFQGFVSLIPGFVENGWLSELALNGVVCVPLFFFLGGYGLYKRRQAGAFRLLDAVIRLYKQYWKVFVIFVPLGLLVFSHGTDALQSYCVRFQFSSAKQLLIDLLSSATGFRTVYNSEWWFFSAYLCVLPLGCLLCQAIRGRGSFLSDIFLVFCIDILTHNLFPALAKTTALASLNSNLYFNRFFLLNKYSSCFFCGIVFAKHDLIAAMKRRLTGCALWPALALAGGAAAVLCRVYVTKDVSNADIVLTPALVVFLSVLLDALTPLRLLLGFLGRHSANMWLVHTFYCYYFLGFTKLVYCTRCVWIDLAVLTGLSLTTSVLLELLYRYLGLFFSGLRKGKAQAAQ